MIENHPYEWQIVVLCIFVLRVGLLFLGSSLFSWFKNMDIILTKTIGGEAGATPKGIQ